MAYYRDGFDSFQSSEVVLVGGIPVILVKQIIQTLGANAIAFNAGHLTVQQAKDQIEPETIQLQCSFLGADRYIQKGFLEALHKGGVPFPFISGLVWKPLVTIEALAFYQAASRKVLTGGPAVDFIIRLKEVLQEPFVEGFIKVLGAGINAIKHPDRGLGKKMSIRPPSHEVLADVLISQSISYGELEYEDIPSNTLNNKYDKIPVDPNGYFPQVVKFTYPPSRAHSEIFNDIVGMPEGYSGYEFPAYNDSHLAQIVFKFLPRFITQAVSGTQISPSGLYDQYSLNLQAFIDDVEVFNRRIVEGIVYKIGQYEVVFSEILMREGNVHPYNASGGDFGSKLSGGIRLISD